ncbi:MAG: vanadium-dependent haloperoxidase [Bacteroidota bacterium]
MNAYHKLLFCAVVFQSAGFSAAAQSREQTLHRLNQLLVTTVMDDLFTPPVACRIYTYPNIAFYECLRNEDPSFPPLSGKLNGLLLPKPEKNTAPDFFIAACIAFSRTGESLVGSEYKIRDWREAFLDSLKKITDSTLLSVSLNYGNKIAAAVIAWHKKDRYAETRGMMRYVTSHKPGKWQPTPIDFAPGLEPHWKSIRPMTLKTAAQFSPAKKLAYSMSKQSAFYKNVMEVYQTGRKNDSVKKSIAYYWDDNPNISVEQGHFNYFIHKISPAGHWVMITGQVCTEKNIPVLRASQAYALAAISMFDGFISCWHEKYTSELIRPVTVIHRYIDEKWEPLIQTPPFPEFTSGHAVISTAAATVLTGLFGDNYSFTDNTETPFGIAPRSFASFLKASEECAWSRVYGGIHYPETARISIQQGSAIGRHVIKTCLPGVVKHK